MSLQKISAINNFHQLEQAIKAKIAELDKRRQGCCFGFFDASGSVLKNKKSILVELLVILEKLDDPKYGIDRRSRNYSKDVVSRAGAGVVDGYTYALIEKASQLNSEKNYPTITHFTGLLLGPGNDYASKSFSYYFS